MKKIYPKLERDIFDDVGHRARGHIIDRLLRTSDPERVVTMPGWKEIDLYEFVKSAIDHKVFTKYVDDSTFNFKDDSGESLVTKKNELPNGQYPVIRLDNNVAKELLSFYNKGLPSAEPNDYFLQLEKNRAYGFVVLNVHSADIDFKIEEGSKENRLMIRYNENVSNTTIGWQTRMKYISRIFSNIGFDVENKKGYLHMLCSAPESLEQSLLAMDESIRGLASTTHLNLTFQDFPDTLDQAVAAFQSGVTDVYNHIESLPFVAKKRLADRLLFGSHGRWGGE